MYNNKNLATKKCDSKNSMGEKSDSQNFEKNKSWRVKNPIAKFTTAGSLTAKS